MDRRKFLKLAGASLVAVTVLPKVIDNIPKIWGDGIHNDSPGMQALVNGDIFEWMGKGKGPTNYDGKVFFPAGEYRVTSTITLPKNARLSGKQTIT